MGNLAVLLNQWSAVGRPRNVHEAAEFSIALAGASSATEIEARLKPETGDNEINVFPAFAQELRAETGDRFWILRFPQLTAAGTEALAFAVARELRMVLEAESVRPVLLDSLIGGASVADEVETEAALVNFCSTDDRGPGERGWAPFGLGVLEAWKKSRGAGVTIASIDTGFTNHQQQEQVISSDKEHLNLVEGGSNAEDRFSTDVRIATPGHGTLVASVIASRGSINSDATTDGLKDVTGSAPEAKILPIRALRSTADIRQSRIPAAIEHAIAQDADVIIMALGSPFPIEPVEVALRAAVKRGLVVVCAAGNCFGKVVFPARFSLQGLAAAIAAVDHALSPWEKTSKGDAVTASAFGEAVWGAKKNAVSDPDDRIAPTQGTTLASSLTAGIAALWIDAHGGRQALKGAADRAGVTVQKLFNDALQTTAFRPSGWSQGMGAGLVNAGRLVSHPLPAPEEVPSDLPIATDHVTPLHRLLPSAAGEEEALAGLEAAGVPEDLAAEALWRLYQNSARERAAASGVALVQGGEESVQRRSASKGLVEGLSGRTRLAKLLL